MIKKVIYAAAIDTIKPIFNSIFITSDKAGSITAIATDSRRLSMITREIDSEAFIGHREYPSGGPSGMPKLAVRHDRRAILTLSSLPRYSASRCLYSAP